MNNKSIKYEYFKWASEKYETLMNEKNDLQEQIFNIEKNIASISNDSEIYAILKKVDENHHVNLPLLSLDIDILRELMSCSEWIIKYVTIDEIMIDSTHKYYKFGLPYKQNDLSEHMEYVNNWIKFYSKDMLAAEMIYTKTEIQDIINIIKYDNCIKDYDQDFTRVGPLDLKILNDDDLLTFCQSLKRAAMYNSFSSCDKRYYVPIICIYEGQLNHGSWENESVHYCTFYGTFGNDCACHFADN